jgi:CDGSH-type Zn-finger protein
MEKTGADGPEQAERETATERHDVEPGAVITPYPDGPLIVRGRFVITGRDGQPVPAGRKTVALCRCGKSGSKPFCDGSHTRTGFRAPGHALASAPPAARAPETAQAAETAEVQKPAQAAEAAEAPEGSTSEGRPAPQQDSR